MWGNRLFRADDRNAKTDADGKLKIKGIIPGLEYYVIDSRAESGPRDMYFTKTMALIPLEQKERKITSLEGIDITFDMDRAEDKRFLICFWDMNQRPSRNCILQLAKQAEQLRENDLVVIAIQASKVEGTALDEWKKKYDISLISMIEGDAKKVRFIYGVQSLPWLILTDRTHIVFAEGFSVAELEKHLGQLGDK
jgi:hypothetical protein